MEKKNRCKTGRNVLVERFVHGNQMAFQLRFSGKTFRTVIASELWLDTALVHQMLSEVSFPVRAFVRAAAVVRATGRVGGRDPIELVQPHARRSCANKRDDKSITDRRTIN